MAPPLHCGGRLPPGRERFECVGSDETPLFPCRISLETGQPGVYISVAGLQHPRRCRGYWQRYHRRHSRLPSEASRRHVALLEPGHVGSSDAGHTTAHGSAVPGTSFSALVDSAWVQTRRAQCGRRARPRSVAFGPSCATNASTAGLRGYADACTRRLAQRRQARVTRSGMSQTVATSLGIEASFVERSLALT